MGRLLDIARQRTDKAALEPLASVLGTTDQQSQTILAHVKPIEQWDACDRAVFAQANGLPLPPGWAVITGVELMNAIHPERAASNATMPIRASVRRASPRLPATDCPGCFQPLGDTPCQWDAEAVCVHCHDKAQAAPDGFAYTLGRAVAWNVGSAP